MNKTKRRIFLIPPDQKILLTVQKEITELCEILRELVIYRQDDRAHIAPVFMQFSRCMPFIFLYIRTLNFYPLPSPSFHQEYIYCPLYLLRIL